MGRNQKFTRDYLEEIPTLDTACQQICRVAEIRGKGLVQLILANGDTTLAVLPPKFRGVLWLRRGISLNPYASFSLFLILGALVIAGNIVDNTGEMVDVEGSKVTLTIDHLLTKDHIKEFSKADLMYSKLLFSGFVLCLDQKGFYRRLRLMTNRI
jgi:hypothetical protein